MTRGLMALLVFGLLLSGTTRISGQTAVRSAQQDYRVATVAEGLVQPWAIVFLPGGDVLVTERPGRLRIIRQGKLLPQAVEGLPAGLHDRQAGLFEVMPHPDFASNRLLYLTYAKPVEDGKQGTTAVIRARFDNDRLTNVEHLFEAVSRGRGHYGGQLAFDKNGFLFISIGDRQVPPEGISKRIRRRTCPITTAPSSVFTTMVGYPRTTHV